MRHSRIRKKVFSVLVQERTLRQASMLHATSVGEYSDIRKAGLEQPVAIIPNGVDVPELFHNKMGRDNRRLLYVGRIHPIKGLELVLDCWTQLTGSYPDWVFRIVGPLDSNYAVKLKERYLLNRVPRVEFVGERSGQALIKEYQDADALVLPSLSENFGMVVAESLSNATPVLTTKGTPWEGLCKNKCGWWVDRDGEDLCVALQQILSAERDVLRRMGLQGRQWMIEEFSWRQVAKNMLSAYLWLLEKGERPTFVHD
jgi:glycosyltransferase involved in cell wall biosynthesis